MTYTTPKKSEHFFLHVLMILIIDIISLIYVQFKTFIFRTLNKIYYDNVFKVVEIVVPSEDCSLTVLDRKEVTKTDFAFIVVTLVAVVVVVLVADLHHSFLSILQSILLAS